MESAGRRGVFVVMDAKRAGHAQMRDQDGIGVQMHDEKLRAPPDRDDAPSRHPCGEILWEGKSKIRPALFDRDNPRAFHDGRKPAPDSLDFGQFRHRRA